MNLTPVVHIGREIESRINQLRISESDFARLINTSRQNVNRILKKESIDTALLQKYCDALDFNFFTLYCPPPSESYQASTHGIAAKQISSIDNREMIEEKEETIELRLPPDCPEETRHIIEKLTLENSYLRNMLNEKERFITHLLASK
ncbi:MAG: helix-turn-helix domain-containing protein [Bacteroides sp.]|nr:helix-turn-helix domain-containing protein [Bacteroides sp.]